MHLESSQSYFSTLRVWAEGSAPKGGAGSQVGTYDDVVLRTVQVRTSGRTKEGNTWRHTPQPYLVPSLQRQDQMIVQGQDRGIGTHVLRLHIVEASAGCGLRDEEMRRDSESVRRRAEEICDGATEISQEVETGLAL